MIPPSVDHNLSELSAMTCPSWVALHSMAHSFIELHKPLHHDKAVIHMNKVSGYNEIPAELFTSLKEEAIKALHSLCQQIWKTQKWPQDWKRSILIPIPKKGITKKCANHWTITLILYASNAVFKILHARLQDYVSQEIPDVQAGFRKEKGTKDQVVNICWLDYKESKGISEKHLLLFHQLCYSL